MIPEPFTGQSISVSNLERLRQLALTNRILPSPDIMVSPSPGTGTRLRTRQQPAPPPAAFDYSVFGIQLIADAQHPGYHTNARIHERRIIRHQPDSYAGDQVLIQIAQADLALSAGYNAGAPENPLVIAVVWLNYNLETPASEISWEKGDDSAARLYAVEIEKHEGEGEAPDKYTAEISRIFRPGDIDIEPAWLPAIEPEEE